MRHIPLTLTGISIVLVTCAFSVTGRGTEMEDPGVVAAATHSSALTDAKRATAAASTANSGTNACSTIGDFYTEIGGSAAVKWSLSRGPAYTSATPMNIASATKLVYAAYVAQKRAGALTANDIKYLNFRSGYTSFSACLPSQTINDCLSYRTNRKYTAANNLKFFYNGGHMQKHAVAELGIGGWANAAFAADMNAQIGGGVAFAFFQPQAAGGLTSTPANYGLFLRRILANSLQMNRLQPGMHPTVKLRKRGLHAVSCLRKRALFGRPLGGGRSGGGRQRV